VACRFAESSLLQGSRIRATRHLLVTLGSAPGLDRAAAGWPGLAWAGVPGLHRGGPPHEPTDRFGADPVDAPVVEGGDGDAQIVRKLMDGQQPSSSEWVGVVVMQGGAHGLPGSGDSPARRHLRRCRVS
jgi:hypothetical protein